MRPVVSSAASLDPSVTPLRMAGAGLSISRTTVKKEDISLPMAIVFASLIAGGVVAAVLHQDVIAASLLSVALGQFVPTPINARKPSAHARKTDHK